MINASPNTSRLLKFAALTAASLFAMASAGLAQVTVGYTFQPGDLTSSYGTGNNSSTYSGNFDNNSPTNTQIGLYANGSGQCDETTYENFTTSGNGSSGNTSRGLYAGD